MVVCVMLNNMSRDHGKPVRAFSAKLCRQADVCPFIRKCYNCNHEVNYTDTILCDLTWS